ncbi:MAG: hypothetical protein V4488_20765 [Pseudomonadota bacterium]
MKINYKPSDLSDYPAIKKLALALHKYDASQHGAAIMVGAGFSRSAARHVGGEKKMSLWDDFIQQEARGRTYSLMCTSSNFI